MSKEKSKKDDDEKYDVSVYENVSKQWLGCNFLHDISMFVINVLLMNNFLSTTSTIVNMLLLTTSTIGCVLFVVNMNYGFKHCAEYVDQMFDEIKHFKYLTKMKVTTSLHFGFTMLSLTGSVVVKLMS